VVYVPEYVVGHWWEHILHNQSALRLKTRLHYMSGVMVASVPWQLRSSEGAGRWADDLPQLTMRALQTGAPRTLESLIEPEKTPDA